MPFDFDAAVTVPAPARPGLRRLPPGAAQLTPATPGSRHLREKLAVLSAYADQALLARAGFDAGPALARLAQQASLVHPLHLRWDGRRAAAPRLGAAVEGHTVVELARGEFGLGDEVARCLRQLPPPWRLPGLLCLAFDEDYAVVDANDGMIAWLAVALPSFWAPQDQVGRSPAQLSADLADGPHPAAAGPGLAALAAGPERWERLGWTLTGHPRLHAHPRRVDPVRWPATRDPQALAAQVWFRTERQTFIPAPEAGLVILTIRVDVQPLRQALQQPGRARRLHDALASMSEPVLACHGLAEVRAPLLAWLARHAPAP